MAVSVSACTIPCVSSKSIPLAAASSSTSSSLLRLRPLPIGRTTSTCLSRPRLLPLVKAKQQTFSSFDDLLENSDKPVLVDFYATWCGPCQFMAPILNEVSTQLKDKIQVVKIDTEKYPSLADKYRIEALPTFIIFKDGEPYDRFEGALTADQLTQRIENSLKVKQ
ncbi:thioredoxin Y1, chloroplastic-like [Fagus crenata]